MRKSGFMPVLMLLSAAAAAGCSRDRLVPTAGVVQLDGQPVAGATVSLVPAAADGRLGDALTKEDGSFAINTGREPGAQPGEYKVVVYKTTDRRYDDEGRRPPAVRSEIPPVYSKDATTPLRCRVPDHGQLVLELKSK